MRLLAVLLVASHKALAAAEADLDLILYAADGCVGHFAASHLAAQPGLKWAIAGRTRAKLEAVAADLAAAGGPSSKPEIIVATLDGKMDLGAVVRRARAVATAAGPFSIHGGEYLVKACAENGVHYTDTSDEFYWQRRMVDGYDTVAKKTGARMVLSSGFCALAGDLGSQLALEAIGAGVGDEVAVDAWLDGYNGGLSAGVINTAGALKNATYPKEWDTDPYVLAPSAPQALRVDRGPVEGMTYPTWVSGEGLVIANIFGPYDARLMRRTFTERGQSVRLRVGSFSSMYAKWTAFLASHPGSWSKLAKCPSTQVYTDGSWKYTFKATSSTATKSVTLSGEGDPGYKFTSHGLAEAALCLAGKTLNCLKTGSAGGVYTSMSTMNATGIRDRLVAIGLMESPTVQAVDPYLVV